MSHRGYVALGILLRTCGLASIYLLVLTSLDPGDVALGLLLGLAIVVGLRVHSVDSRVHPPVLVVLRAVIAMMVGTAREMVIGSWRAVRFCLGGPAAPGFVEIPRGDRSHRGVALWGVLTGEAPDEYPVDVDDERGVLIVHLVDARDPDSVRERHGRAHERTLRHLVP
jgi:multisubunit Na+/H+ antiporter MnhE subunit